MKQPSSTMINQQNQSTIALATIFACRMLGLFMILPVISLYTDEIPGATPALIGLALGIYGFTQACLQIPLGMLSDHIGRKLIIALGLGVFIIGSIVAACASSIDGIIIGRALQGLGAVGSTILALISDLTTVENRTKAMAVIGLTIGSSFIIAIILGPIINNIAGLSGIFWLTALLGLLAMAVLFFIVPTPATHVRHRDTEPVPALFKSVLKNSSLLRLDFGIFSLHAILTASFITVPISLAHAGLNSTHQWQLYVPVLVIAFCSMLPLIIIAEKRRKMKPMLLFAIGLLALTLVLAGSLQLSIWGLAICLWLFFTAFTFLEASLPSLISKIAPAGSKGTAMGVYSTSQFFGIFIGGSVGGWLFGQLGHGLLLICALLAVVWFISTLFMQKPVHLSTLMLAVRQLSQPQARELSQLLETNTGVAEALIQPEEGIVYLKINKQLTSETELRQLTDAYTAKIV